MSYNMEETVGDCVDWMVGLSEERQREALRHLFWFAIEAEFIDMHSLGDAEEIAEERGVSLEEYLETRAPYFAKTGGSLA